MRTFPIMLKVAHRRAVVVGGGPVGLRRAEALAAAGADVLLVAPESPEPDLPRIRLVRQTYSPILLDGARLVLACTNDARLNRRIAADARQRGALANVADGPDDCDFFLPAILADGDVVVAVGTGGAAPALASRIRDTLAAALPKRTGEFAALLGELRETLKQQVPDAPRRRRIAKALAGEKAFEAFCGGGPDAVRELVAELMRGD